ncbi:hypothetical protein L6452_19318 [Arctium lappa]|uniref:Uncharacterized protein n=1 Tax=Arctium lappa TaxID=4217 RepID=A0ACB9B7J7_ARCLA|nr:hypothetical protein L6452_19318 [Arctium lappa]
MQTTICVLLRVQIDLQFQIQIEFNSFDLQTPVDPHNTGRFFNTGRTHRSHTPVAELKSFDLCVLVQ